MYLGWNDYELIYLIKEGNYKALNLMYHKYSAFIRLKARECGFKGFYLDDCVQEGLILLNKALKLYDSSYNKSFWSYFNLILQRRLWRFYKEIKPNYHDVLAVEIKDDNVFKERVIEYSSVFKDEHLKMVYKEIYYYNTKVEDLANKLGVKPYTIYRDLKKIKEILRLEFDL